MICLVGVCKVGRDGTGCVLVGGRVGCILVKGVSWLHWHSCCSRGTTVGVDAWIYICSSFSELKLSAPSSWGMSEEEN